LPGAEITVAGKIFIVETRRSLALRDFCARLIGWGEARAATVDHALRAIRLANVGRAILVLRGTGDLVPVAHAIHRHTLGDDAPFVVSDPQRGNTRATVRGPANRMSGVEAARHAFRGTLCVRSSRPPSDMGMVLRVFRAPASSVRLIACAEAVTMPALDSYTLNIARIDIPSLDTRRDELPRIVCEYIDDAIDRLDAPSDCLNARDVERIMSSAAFGSQVTIPAIEKATLRAVALKVALGDRVKAATLLGMALNSLTRWVHRRSEWAAEIAGNDTGANRRMRPPR